MNAERALPAAVAVCCAVAIVLSSGLLVAVEPRTDPVEEPDHRPAGVDGVFDADRVGDTPGHGHFAPTGPPNRLSFTVHHDSDAGPLYYRVAAYDSYTGVGWQRSTDLLDREAALGSPVPAPDDEDRDATARTVDAAAGDDARVRVHTVEQAYEAEHRTVMAPSVAEAVEASGGPVGGEVDPLAATDQGNLDVRRPFEEGTDYGVRSRVVRPTPEALRATADDAVPAAVRERYTRLPEGTPAVVRERAEEITADAETPYGKAAAVERWLETNREFALRGTESRRVAATFLTEQEAGYSEQFATTMAVLLRAQDVPARYVVGYAPSGYPDDNTAHLYAANAHAWVEVYFPDVGWVRFDPTPAAPRAATEAAAVEEAQRVDPDAGDAPYRPPLSAGSPAERVAGGYAVELNRTAVPGARVTATVAHEGTGAPVADATVFFGDRKVGRTDARGRVTGRVPYDEALRVSVRRDLPTPASAPGDDSDEDDRTPLATAGVADAGASLASASTTALGAVGGLSPVGVASAADVDDDDDDGDAYGERREGPIRAGSRVPAASFPVRTDASLEVLGTPREGQPARVRVTVEGVPLREGRVAVVREGIVRESATTGTDGVATIRLPHDEAVSLRASKGPVETFGTVQPEPWLNVSVAGHAVPGREATVVASRDGEPASGAVVRVDGRTVGETGPDGRLRVRVPLDNDATITATRGDALGRHHADWLFAWAIPPVALALGGLGWGLVSLFGVPLVGAGAAGAAPLLVRAARRLRGLTVALGEGLRRAVTRPGVAFGNLLAWLGRRASGGLEGLVAGLVGVAGVISSRALPWLAGLPGRLRSMGPAGVVRRVALAPVLVVTGLATALAAAPGLFRAWLVAGGDGADPAPATDDDAAAGTGAATFGLVGAWRRFLALAPVEVRPSLTPGELARAAVAAGVPERPVRTLTGLFRQVRYGGRDRDETVDDAARRAVGAVASALGATGDDAEADARGDADDGGDAA